MNKTTALHQCITIGNCTECEYKSPNGNPLVICRTLAEDIIKEQEHYRHLCKVLFNRCRAISNSDKDHYICDKCNIKKECEEMHSV